MPAVPALLLIINKNPRMTHKDHTSWTKLLFMNVWLAAPVGYRLLPDPLSGLANDVTFQLLPIC